MTAWSKSRRTQFFSPERLPLRVKLGGCRPGRFYPLSPFICGLLLPFRQVAKHCCPLFVRFCALSAHFCPVSAPFCPLPLSICGLSVRFRPLSGRFCSRPVSFCPVPGGLGRPAGCFRTRAASGASRLLAACT